MQSNVLTERVLWDTHGESNVQVVKGVQIHTPVHANPSVEHTPAHANPRVKRSNRFALPDKLRRGGLLYCIV